MKKRILLPILVIALIATYALPAQALSIGLGLKGGCGLSNAIADAKVPDNAKPRLSPTLGMFIDLNISTLLTVEVNLIWRQMGYKNDVTDTTRDLDYFHLEPLAKLYLIPRQAPLSFYLLAGMFFGGVLKQEQKNWTKNDIDIGFTFGFGVKFNLGGKWGFLLETHANFGLMSFEGSLKNIAGYLNAGIMYTF